MKPLKRIDILRPKGQRLSIGDLVRIKPTSKMYYKVKGTDLFRIIFSYAQRKELGATYDPDILPYDLRLDQFLIINIETKDLHSWLQIDELERVAETLDQSQELERDLSAVRQLFRSSLNHWTAKGELGLVNHITRLRNEVCEILEGRLATLEPDFDIDKDDVEEDQLVFDEVPF